MHAYYFDKKVLYYIDFAGYINFISSISYCQNILEVYFFVDII